MGGAFCAETQGPPEGSLLNDRCRRTFETSDVYTCVSPHDNHAACAHCMLSCSLSGACCHSALFASRQTRLLRSTRLVTRAATLLLLITRLYYTSNQHRTRNSSHERSLFITGICDRPVSPGNSNATSPSLARRRKETLHNPMIQHRRRDPDNIVPLRYAV
jgi:hypothetical protein